MMRNVCTHGQNALCARGLPHWALLCTAFATLVVQQELPADQTCVCPARCASPIYCMIGEIVSPWTKIEKATTANAAMMISRRSVIVSGSVNARTSASAPRRPPHTRMC